MLQDKNVKSVAISGAIAECLLAPANVGGIINIPAIEARTENERGVLRWVLALPANTNVVLGGQTTSGVSAVHATNLDSPAWPSDLLGMHALQVLGASGAALNFLGVAENALTATANGFAEVNSASGTLEMSRLTSTDTVSLELGRAVGWTLQLLPWIGTRDAPDGSSTSLTVVGRRNGTEGQTLGVLNIGFDSGYPICFLNANFSAIGAPVGTIELFQNGTRILQRSNVSLGCDLGNHPLSVSRISGNQTGFVVKLPANTGLEPTGGGLYSGDEVRFIASPVVNPAIEYDQRITLAGAGGIRRVGIGSASVNRLITGAAILDDYQYVSPRATTLASIEIFKPGNLIPVETHVVSLDSTGAYSVATPVWGDVELRVKTATSLAKRIRNLWIGENGITGSTSPLLLENGDVDGDNVVSVFDYIVLSDSFDQGMGDAGYVLGADLDGDSVISIFDYIILSDHFDSVGDD